MAQSKKSGKTRQPLLGKRIVVTRSKKQAGLISSKLKDLGATTIEIPTIRFESICGPEKERAFAHIDMYEMVIFTSANAVEMFFASRSDKKEALNKLSSKKIAAIGSATMHALQDLGFDSIIVPDEFVAEGLIKKVKEKKIDLKGKMVLLPRAEKGRALLVHELEKMGAIVDDVAVYRTLPENFAEDPDALEGMKIPPDIITFTSSSTARYFDQGLPEDLAIKIKSSSIAACIGPITADTAEKLGFNVKIVAHEYSIEGLIEGIVEYFSG